MTDAEFLAWLHGYLWARQSITSPDPFPSIVPYFKNEDGTINRAKTLALGSFSAITGMQREKLLEVRE